MDSTSLVDLMTKENFKINFGILNSVQWVELLKVQNGPDKRGLIMENHHVQDMAIQ